MGDSSRCPVFAEPPPPLASNGKILTLPSSAGSSDMLDFSNNGPPRPLVLAVPSPLTTVDPCETSRFDCGTVMAPVSLLSRPGGVLTHLGLYSFPFKWLLLLFSCPFLFPGGPFLLAWCLALVWLSGVAVVVSGVRIAELKEQWG